VRDIDKRGVCFASKAHKTNPTNPSLPQKISKNRKNFGNPTMTNKKPLTLDEYQNLAARTAGAGGNGNSRLIISALGLAGEAGEFANLVKKRTAHGHDISPEILADELGDVLWYISEAATACGLSLDALAQQNVEKLRKRYPEGFSEERSRNRTA
jgi:NTP pyrophosphatase (non-canonical NTP hydrolase)